MISMKERMEQRMRDELRQNEIFLGHQSEIQHRTAFASSRTDENMIFKILSGWEKTEIWTYNMCILRDGDLDRLKQMLLLAAAEERWLLEKIYLLSPHLKALWSNVDGWGLDFLGFCCRFTPTELLYLIFIVARPYEKPEGIGRRGHLGREFLHVIFHELGVHGTHEIKSREALRWFEAIELMKTDLDAFWEHLRYVKKNFQAHQPAWC